MATEISLNKSETFILNNVNSQLDNIKSKKECSTLYLSGKPGIGKSAFIDQICRKNGMGLLVRYMGTMLIEQITGLPDVSKTNTDHSINWSLPELFSMKGFRVEPQMVTRSPESSPIQRIYADPSKPIILLLDDAHLCNKTIQSYMFQLLSYRSIHNHKLPDNVVIILAGNRSTDRAGFQPILAPIVNRIFFLDVKGEVDDWVNNFAAPNNVREDIVHFLNLYNECFQSEPLESLPWASPRSWTYAAQALDDMERRYPGFFNDENTKKILTIVEGHVGTEFASKYVEYVKVLKQWPAREILQGKTSLPDIVHLKRSDNYALCSSLVIEFIKILKESDPTLSNQAIIDKHKDEFGIIKESISRLVQVQKEIVPYVVKSLLFSGKQGPVTVSIVQNILAGNKELVDCLKSMLRV